MIPLHVMADVVIDIVGSRYEADGVDVASSEVAMGIKLEY